MLVASKTQNIKVLELKTLGIGQNTRKMQIYSNRFNSKSWIDAGKEIHIPTIIVHGTADENVEPYFSKERAGSIRSSRLELIEGPNYRFTAPGDLEKCISVIAEFLISHLK